MKRGRGPALLLGALGVAFLTAFVVQRGRSDFLAAEERIDEARKLAAAHGFATSEVLALHELHGGRLPVEQLDALVAELEAERDALGDVLLGVLALRGKRALAEELRRQAGDDPARLRELIAATREAVEDAVRFEKVAERYEARGH